MKIRTLLVLTSVAALFTCEPVPDFCGTGELYDPSCAFCYGSMPYSYCENEKRKYNPLLQGCVPTSGVIGTRCSDGRVVMSGTPCGGYTLTVAVTPEHAGEFSPPPSKMNFAAGEQLFLHARSTDTNYVFAGWGGAVTSVENGKIFEDVMKGVNPQLQIVAIFKPKSAGKLLVDASPQGAGEVTRAPDKEIYEDGETITVTANDRQGSGYTFVRWAGADTSKTNPLQITMRESQTLVAIFTPVAHTLVTAVSPAGAGAVYINDNAMTGDEPRDVGAEVAVLARANEGYEFSHWTGNDAAEIAGVYDRKTNVSLASNASITAHFVRGYRGEVEPPQPATTYKLEVKVLSDDKENGDGGYVTLSNDGPNYNSGIQVMATATANEGYNFAGWSGASTSNEQTVTVTMVDNKWLTANFTRIDDGRPPVPIPIYTLTTNGYPALGGTVVRRPVGKDNAENSYDSGTVVTLTAVAANGFRFTEWSGDVVADAINTEMTITMDGDKTVTASFQLIPAPTYTLNTNVTPAGGGTISRNPSGTTANSYESGTSVTVMATPAEGYEFTGWSGDVDAAASSITITMNGDKSLTAHFVSNSNGEAGPSVTYGGKTYNSVMIGGKAWMSENLDYEPWSGSWCYDNISNNCDKYGRLYNWATAETVCPPEWRLPSNAEWSALVDEVERDQKSGPGTAAMYLKSTSDWSNRDHGSDYYRFSALPGGNRNSEGNFYHADSYGYWWTATESSVGYAYGRGMDYSLDNVYDSRYAKDIGFSVRCVKDD